MSNPFYSGIIVGSLLSLGFSILFFIDFFYGISLMGIGITYYYYKAKEFIKKEKFK